MTSNLAARCGIYCGECEFRESAGCPGCVAAGGCMFWGACEIARCCAGRELEHCGRCPDFPCDLLERCAYDKDQGDHGRRIRNLENWNAMGFEKWLENRLCPY